MALNSLRGQAHSEDGLLPPDPSHLSQSTAGETAEVSGLGLSPGRFQQSGKSAIHSNPSSVSLRVQTRLGWFYIPENRIPNFQTQ